MVSAPSADRLVTAAEVAQLLNMKESWVRDHTRQGNIPALRLGRFVRYSVPAVLEWAETQSRGRA